jgi:hypothetical protein
MTKLKTIYVVLAVALSGCAYSIKDIDVSKADPSCTHQCTTAYSQCVSGGPSVGFKTETLRACRESYEVCISACPNK